ncbi:hypothetical protein BG004_002945 [Podila humilis]|nr:hypothetical protein BG004_002945 [Podila humilis]
MHPQTTSVHPLNPIQLPPLSPLTIGSSPRSAPQQHSLHMGSHHHSNHYPHSATGSTISPYPTPQHHPQHFSSPHQSPRYDRILPKQSIPAMNLPASALASSTTAFQVAPSRPSLSSYPPPTHSPAGDGKKGTVASSAFGSGSATSQFPSPHIHATDSRSAPGSPQRYLMLPPQVAPSLASSSLPSVPVLKNGSSSNNSKRSSTSKKGAGAAAAAAGGGTSKRRASSNAKAVDQETRDMMRKVSHSAIERRRRERINDKILQLKHLVPSCVDEDHLHKLSILQSTIEYIQHLKAALPDTVVNMKLKKATNNNPNNKTTDMLEAMGGMLSTKTTQQHQQLTPMLTTGLGPQQQRQHSTSSSSTSSYPLYASPTPLAARTAGRGSGINGSNSNSNTSEAMNEDESEPYPSSSSRPDMGHRYSTCSNASMMSSSSSCHSSDEDAKDGLLLLSGASESHHQVGSSSSHSSPDRRRQNRRKKRGEVDGDDEDDEDYV